MKIDCLLKWRALQIEMRRSETNKKVNSSAKFAETFSMTTSPLYSNFFRLPTCKEKRSKTRLAFMLLKNSCFFVAPL